MGSVSQLRCSAPEQPVHGNASLWRYISLKTLFFYLNRTVFFPSVAKLKQGDPFEGEAQPDTEWFNTAFKGRYNDWAGSVDGWIRKKRYSDLDTQMVECGAHVFRKRYFEFIFSTRFAWCWFESDRESAAMWKVYGNQGAAIRSSAQCVERVLSKTKLNFLYRRMRYVPLQGGFPYGLSPDNPVDAGLLLRPFFLKAVEYESEKEVRFVTSAPEAPEWASDGLILDGCDPAWITEIRLWPWLTCDEEIALKEAIKSLAPNITCNRSDLAEEELPMRATRDAMRDSELEAWLENRDDIPAALKEV